MIVVTVRDVVLWLNNRLNWLGSSMRWLGMLGWGNPCVSMIVLEFKRVCCPCRLRIWSGRGLEGLGCLMICLWSFKMRFLSIRLRNPRGMEVTIPPKRGRLMILWQYLSARQISNNQKISKQHVLSSLTIFNG